MLTRHDPLVCGLDNGGQQSACPGCRSDAKTQSKGPYVIFDDGYSTTNGDCNGADKKSQARQEQHETGECGESRESVSLPKPEIVVSTIEHQVNASAAAALAGAPTIYQRGSILVRIVHDTSPAAKGIRRPLAPRIEPLPQPLLRELLTAVATWKRIRQTSDGAHLVPAHPPPWCVSAVHAHAEWPGVRHLEAIVDYPVIHPNGSILSKDGYDAQSGLLLESTCQIQLPTNPSPADAVAGRDRLLEMVVDFPFARDIHKAAWLAALLTPLARFAFSGPCPLFLVDANVRAAGKGLLLDCISRIITGERFTIASYTQDEDEIRKRITSLALSGERLVLFDNLEGKFGSATLDAALTATSWEDRLLGSNKMAKCPLFMTWFATGNNVMLAADTARRVCHIRLESDRERPEERQGFRCPDLLSWISEHRAELLTAALAILRGYIVAGRPDMKLPAWGSFDGWSRLVRAAVVWVGMPDPGETRRQLQDQADIAAESMTLLLSCWEQLDPERRGLTTSEVIGRLTSPDHRGEVEENCRSAIESLVGSRIDARALGNKLRQYRRRIFKGRYFDRAGTSHQAARWAVFSEAEFSKRPENAPKTPHTPPDTSDEPF